MEGVDTVNSTNTSVSSSLLLQQLLFYNYYLSPAWFFSVVFIIVYRYGSGLSVSDPDEIRTAVLFLWLLAEPVRLWTGYSGNLKENVPILLVFWLLTFFVSTPVSFYFSFAQMDIKPYDKGINITVLVMLLLELGTGVYAAAKIMRSQSRKYYLEEYTSAVEKIHTN
ncbi:putative membrane protein [Chloropicon roscoffensis]|uniref:Membrane protein n=1 Tax=Chloropicon roscoffensis TaxID=1461544 RepID=A0AAX4P840_9CHLO